MAKKDKKDKKSEAPVESSDSVAVEKPTDETTQPVSAKTADADTDSGKKEELDSHAIHVKVYSPYQTYFDDTAQSVSAENDTGPFDILPKHHNFMTLVNACEVTIRIEGGQDKRIRISRGVLHVHSNKVTLFLDV